MAISALKGFQWAFGKRTVPQPDPRADAFLLWGVQPETPIGAGMANRVQFRLTDPQTYAYPGVVLNGLGGLQHGQFAFTPLIPYNPNNTGS